VWSHNESISGSRGEFNKVLVQSSGLHIHVPPNLRLDVKLWSLISVRLQNTRYLQFSAAFAFINALIAVPSPASPGQCPHCRDLNTFCLSGVAPARRGASADLKAVWCPMLGFSIMFCGLCLHVLAIYEGYVTLKCRGLVYQETIIHHTTMYIHERHIGINLKHPLV
jgi:hypothetical protein